MSHSTSSIPWWALVLPVLALGALGGAYGRPLGAALAAGVFVLLVASVFVAVHHAELVALRVGEPLGTLVLALCVTVIEVALIGSLMLGGGPDAAKLARDTVYATVMLVCNGVVGLCLLVGGIRHHVTVFRVDGVGQALSALIPLAVLTLVLPSYTLSTPGPTYSVAQLGIISLLSLALWAGFVFVQTIRHRDYFLPEGDADEAAHAAPPSKPVALASLGLLLLSLVAVVGLAKTLAPGIERAVAGAGAPPAFVGVVIAVLVLMPETWAAVRAAARNRMQNSLNLALGSALATIGLTVPAVAALSVLVGMPLELGLAPKETVLLATTLLLSVVTLATGRSTVLHGVVHLVMLGAFLSLAALP
jgi:Ca2+:H+ antiporter